MLSYFGLLIQESSCLWFYHSFDRNQTDLHRFKPNSRDVLLSEQLNPWRKLRLQATPSRHRGHKQKRRNDRSASIILLSLAYLLAVDQ